MITILNLSLLLTFITLSVSSEFSLKGDPCSKFDRCNSKSVSKTCSCDSSCRAYGTCCHDIKKPKQDLAVFQCYSRRTVNPVFAKRSCSEDFRGHVGVKLGCLEEDEDEMDVRNNLLMTSRATKITYWNKLCAACNNEIAAELDSWNIVVFCPSHKEIDRYLIRTNLTFHQDKLQWGLVISGEFQQCIVKYSLPPYVDEVKHCTPNVIASCPADYENEAVSIKCSQYYAERKLKKSDTYFKNVHCAICNGVDVKELECPGMPSPGDEVEEGDFRDMVEEIFTNGEWLDKVSAKEFECSTGYSYDPFREKCRTYRIKEEVTMISSSARGRRKGSLAILVPLVTLLSKMVIF